MKTYALILILAMLLSACKNEKPIASPKKPKIEKRFINMNGLAVDSSGLKKYNDTVLFAFYRHDTNHKDYFVKNKRSLSSGCVRVEEPLLLAAHMLNDEENWNIDKIYEVILTKETTRIKLKERIGIYQWYWTAWSEDQKLVFRDDIYNLDMDLYEKLRN